MITASTLMRCKALGLADALPEKTYSTTSIAMDWPHKQQRLHLLRQQHLLRHLLLHQLLLQHQLPLQHRHRPQLLRHALQLHRVIVTK
jgi:hypothetical protein